MKPCLHTIVLALTLTSVSTPLFPMACLAKCVLCCLGLNDKKLDAMFHAEDPDAKEKNLKSELEEAQARKYEQDQEPTSWGDPVEEATTECKKKTPDECV